MTKICLRKNPASLSVILKPSGHDLLRHVTYILKNHWSFWNATASILNCWFLPVWQAPLDPWNSNQLFWMFGKLELINRVACWGQEKADVTYHQVWPYLLTKVQKHERFVYNFSSNSGHQLEKKQKYISFHQIEISKTIFFSSRKWKKNITVFILQALVMVLNCFEFGDDSSKIMCIDDAFKKIMSHSGSIFWIDVWFGGKIFEKFNRKCHQQRMIGWTI